VGGGLQATVQAQIAGGFGSGGSGFGLGVGVGGTGSGGVGVGGVGVGGVGVGGPGVGVGGEGVGKDTGTPCPRFQAGKRPGAPPAQLRSSRRRVRITYSSTL